MTIRERIAAAWTGGDYGAAVAAINDPEATDDDATAFTWLASEFDRNEIPDWATVAEWWLDQAMAAVQEEAAGRLRELSAVMAPAWTPGAHEHSRWMPFPPRPATSRNVETGEVTEVEPRDWTPPPLVAMLPDSLVDADGRSRIWRFYFPVEVLRLATRHKVDNPLTPIIEAWIERPEEAATVQGPTEQGTLFPAAAIVRSPTLRSKGRRNAWKRFSLPAHRNPPNPQLVLPGMASDRADVLTPDIPLDVWEGLGEVSSRKGTLTPATRLFLATLMAAELPDRHGNRFLRAPVAWWFEWIHPNPPRANRSRLWRDLRAAVARINDLPRVDYEYPDGGMEAVPLVAARFGAPKRNDPRDRLAMLVSFPPGADRFAVTMPWLRILQHGVTWRRSRVATLLMRLAMRWAEPNHGRLRVKDRRKWIADRNPDKYRPIGDAEAAALIAPQGQPRPGLAAADLAALAGSGDVLLFGGDGQPISWEGKAPKNRPPEPSVAMVRKVRAAMRGGILKALPSVTGK